MKTRKIKDINGRILTRYYLDLYDDNENYADVKAVLDDTDNPSALLKEAVIKFVRGKGFNPTNYASLRHRKDIE